MTNGTINKALLSCAVLAAYTGSNRHNLSSNSSICSQRKIPRQRSKSTQAHTCHYKAKNSPILHSCNDVVRGSISHPGESKESTK